GSTDPSNTGTATASANWGGAVPITHTDASTPANCTGHAGVDRTWKATDGCGNMSTCLQHITFVDTTAPSITCPPDANVNCGDPSSEARSVATTASANCGAAAAIT